MTRRTSQMIAYYIMAHTRVSEKCIHLSLMYMTDHTFLVLPIKHLVNQYSEPTTPQKISTGTKPSFSNLHVLFSLCFVLKASEHVDTKALNMYHQSHTKLWYISWDSTTSKRVPHIHT